jgi:hypothetical protein
LTHERTSFPSLYGLTLNSSPGGEGFKYLVFRIFLQYISGCRDFDLGCYTKQIIK